MQRQHQPVLEGLLALILDEVELVEACVCCWQACLRPVCLVYLESLRPTDALQSPNSCVELMCQASLYNQPPQN